MAVELSMTNGLLKEFRPRSLEPKLQSPNLQADDATKPVNGNKSPDGEVEEEALVSSRSIGKVAADATSNWEKKCSVRAAKNIMKTMWGKLLSQCS